MALNVCFVTGQLGATVYGCPAHGHLGGNLTGHPQGFHNSAILPPIGRSEFPHLKASVNGGGGAGALMHTTAHE